MTDKQPEALRLADILQHKIPSIECLEVAAAELRRLHDVNAELVEFNDHLCAENDRLLEQRTELVEALSVVIRGVPDTWDGVKQAKAALTKAQGDNNG